MTLTAPQIEQRRTNNARIAAERRTATHCKRGHEFTEENTYVRSTGWRDCRICKRDRKWYWDRGLVMSA